MVFPTNGQNPNKTATLVARSTTTTFRKHSAKLDFLWLFGGNLSCVYVFSNAIFIISIITNVTIPAAPLWAGYRFGRDSPACIPPPAKSPGLSRLKIVPSYPAWRKLYGCKLSHTSYPFAYKLTIAHRPIYKKHIGQFIKKKYPHI